MSLARYVLAHTERGECHCGQCIDRGDKPDPTGHTADLIFFKVAARDNPDRETFANLIHAHEGVYHSVDPLDGREHSFIELGAWIGDQQVALLFMGLGTLLGLFELLTPDTMFPTILGNHPTLRMHMAQSGLVAVQAVA